MKISVQWARVLEVTNVKEKNCKIIGISLGYNKGFAKIIWYLGDKTFHDANLLKKGMNITIPSGDLSVTKYVGANGIPYQNVSIFTTYLEIIHFPKNNNDDQENKNKTKKQLKEILDGSTTDEEINQAFEDLESGLENVDKNNDEQINKEIEFLINLLDKRQLEEYIQWLDTMKP